MAFLRSNSASSVKDIEDNDIKFLYHITSRSHLQSICRFGILSHNKVREKEKIREDISLPGVQSRRERKIIDNKSLHEYACLYFDARNPMLYKVQKEYDDIVILAVDKMVLLEKSTIYSDGNAAADNSIFYSGTEFLNRLNWSKINADYWTDSFFNYSHDELSVEERSRIKCAEILVYPKVRPERIKAAICNTKQNHDFCIFITNQKFPVHLDKGFFFE